MSRITMAVSAMLAAQAMLLHGCGGSSESAPPPPPTATAVAPGTASFLVSPKALALSPKDGQLYVADGGYTACNPSCIRKVDPTTGTVDPTAVVVGMGSIEGIAFDATGDNLYYSDRQNRVVRLTYSGTAYASPAACNDATKAGLLDPYHLAFDPTLGVLIAEGNGNAVVALATCAPTSTATALSTGGSFSMVRGIALGPAGQIYASDFTSTTVNTVTTYTYVKVVDRTTGAATAYATSTTNLGQPSGIQWLGGTSRYANSLLVALQGNTNIVAMNGVSVRNVASFATPALDVAVDTSNSKLFVLTSPTVADIARIYKVTGL